MRTVTVTGAAAGLLIAVSAESACALMPLSAGPPASATGESSVSVVRAAMLRERGCVIDSISAATQKTWTRIIDGIHSIHRRIT